MRQYRHTISHADLLRLLAYDPETGAFTWRVTRGKAIAGKPAGSPRDDGYLVVHVLGHNYRAHRLAWFYVHGQWPSDQIDHVNRDRGDNAIRNLRDVPQEVNMQNVIVPLSNSRSGIRGVSFCKKTNKWLAQLSVNKRLVLREEFTDLAQAGAAYMAAKRAHHPACAL